MVNGKLPSPIYNIHQDDMLMEEMDKKHRGLKVKQALMSKGVDISTLAKRVNLFEEHLHVLFSDRFLDYDIIKFIGNKVGHDFSQEFPEMDEKVLLTYKSSSKADFS